MPPHSVKAPAPNRDKPDYTKRRAFDDSRALIDTAQIATQRLYCDVLKFWRRCRDTRCRRHRRCKGVPTFCLQRNWPFVPQEERLAAQKDVIAGGLRRISPATHAEWQARRARFDAVASWGLE
jgi:hypothetical protein